MWTYTTDSMDFVTVSTGLILPYWMGLPIRYIHLTCKILAKSLAQVCCVIDPEIIVIGGGVSKAGDILTSRISTFFKEYAFHACENTPIVLAKLENDAGMYGCVKSLF